MGKRGVSAVIATILLILIVIAAVVILWMFILPTIKNTFVETVIVDMEILDEGYTRWDSEHRLVHVQVKRGVDDAKIIGYDLIFVFEETSVTHFVDEVLELNTKKVHYINLSGTSGELELIRLVPVFENGKRGSVVSELRIRDSHKKDLSGSGKDYEDIDDDNDDCIVTEVNASHSCYNSSLIRWKDNCGNWREIKEECINDSICIGGECLSPGAIYVDNQLTADCNGSYSIANRDCSGSDGDAYNTPQEAATAAVAGGTVYFRGGTYYPTSRIYIQNKAGTSESAKITFTNYGSEDVIIDGSQETSRGVEIKNSNYIVLKGLKFQDYNERVITYQDSDYGEVRNVIVDGGEDRGIYILKSNHVTIDSVIARNTKNNGICGSLSDYLTITNSVVHDSLYKGIELRGCSHCLIDKNEVYGSRAGIAVIYQDTTNTPSTYNVVTNNIVHDNTIYPEGGNGISVGPESPYCTVANNIAYRNADEGIDSCCGSMYTTIVDNIAFSNGAGEEGDGNGIKVSTNAGGGHLVANNIVFDNTRVGFDQDKALSYPKNFFYNNIAYNNSVYGFFMDAPNLPQEEDAVLYNNIAANNTNRDVKGSYGSDPSSFNDSDYNFWADGLFVSEMDEHSLSGDPMFNNPDLVVDTNFGVGWSIDQKLEYIRNQVKEKFSLKPESPAINNGTIIPGYHNPEPGDNSGDKKAWYGTAPDIGAYEYT